MQIRDNVRRRRRERIEELLVQRPNAEVDHAVSDSQRVSSYSTGPQRMDDPPEMKSMPLDADLEPDPEKWWKEHQRQQRQQRGSTPAWAGAGKLQPGRTDPAGAAVPPDRRLSGFAKSFALRLLIAAVLYGAAWGWFASDLPGSREAESWTMDALTRDMDFQAIEVWYERTFGGSPAFLPIFRGRGETRAVSGAWNREEAVLPVEGRIIQTFAQDGNGVRIAAPGGSEVKAVYAGRILQVVTEDDGKSTVLVQHTGRIVTVYGNLDSPSVKSGDWAEAGQRLGSIPAPLDDGGESLLYFAVKQNGKTLDPAEVVPFD